MKSIRDTVVECALAAAEQSVLRYKDISGGRTVHDHAIETFISSKVAEAIYEARKEVGGTVALEAPFHEVQDLSRARKGRIPDILSPTSRFDICYFENGRPVGVIEVKKRFAAFKADADVNRLIEATRRFGPQFGGSIRFGIWLAVQRIQEGSTSTPEKQIEKFRHAFDWRVAPTLSCRSVTGDFGFLKRRGKPVTEVRIFAAAFDAKELEAA
jgi:hypothetical protein